MPSSLPLWTGVLALVLFLTPFLFLGWWLFFSPFRGPVPSPMGGNRARRFKRTVLFALFGSQLVTMVGTLWEAEWHMRFGTVREEFWWPPHVMLYTGFALETLIALGALLRLRGSIRARFRAEPLLGLLAFIALARFSFGPVDQLWHQIYGKEISGISLPHLLLLAPGTVAALTLVLLTRRFHGGRLLNWLAVLTIGNACWGWMFTLVVDWEYLLIHNALPLVHPIHDRPAWSYLALGIIPSAFVLRAALRVWGARLRAGAALLLMNLWTGSVVLVMLLLGEYRPLWTMPIALLGGAVAMDLWRGRPGEKGNVLVYASIAYGIAAGLTLGVTHVVTLTAADLLTGLVVTLGGSWLTGWFGDRVGAKLVTVDRHAELAAAG
jgi:hypothetical protein